MNIRGRWPSCVNADQQHPDLLANDASAKLPGPMIVAVLLIIAGKHRSRRHGATPALTAGAQPRSQKSIARHPVAGPKRLGRRTPLCPSCSTVVFWAVILLFASTATQIIGLDQFTKWIGSGIIKHIARHPRQGAARHCRRLYQPPVSSATLIRSSAKRLPAMQQVALVRVARRPRCWWWRPLGDRRESDSQCAGWPSGDDAKSLWA